MNPEYLLLPVLTPIIPAVFSFVLPRKMKLARNAVSLLGAAFLVYIAFYLFGRQETFFNASWLGMGMDFDLRLYHFSSFILLGISGFVFLITLYSTVKMAGHPRIKEYFGYLFLTATFASGAVLADNLVLLIFFWEGSMLTLYGLITLGGRNAHKTAVKTFLINGFCDFCLMMGIVLIWHLTDSLTMSKLSLAPESGLAILAFIMMMIGAIGKAGAMPFHTWIPDAATDAPVTVMAFIPASLEKLLGIYLLARIALDFFVLEVNSGLCIVLMTIGGATIVFAVFMALIQKDFKRLLSFHAISQVGYMILGIGTAIPIGIAGGIFHMINHAMYKCGLFLSAGSVEHQTGTTDLRKLGGLYRQMPITTFGFVVCALAISGVWPLNGFVSKEMVFHGAYETGHIIFYLAAWIGAIFTFASFLKAGHSVFFGSKNPELAKVKENKSAIYIPILILAGLCIFFGVYNQAPLKYFIEPILFGHIAPGEHLDFSAHALDLFAPLALLSLLALALAFSLHIYGFNKENKKPYMASEPVHSLPLFKTVYDWAEAGIFDIYVQGIKVIKGLSRFLFRFVDRPIDFIYEKVVTVPGLFIINVLRGLHNGHYANYLAWCIAGLFIIIWVISSLLMEAV